MSMREYNSREIEAFKKASGKGNENAPVGKGIAAQRRQYAEKLLGEYDNPKIKELIRHSSGMSEERLKNLAEEMKKHL